MLSRLLNFRRKGPDAESCPAPAPPVSASATKTSPGPNSALGGKRFETRAPDPRNAIELLDGLWVTDFSFANPGWGGGAFNPAGDHRPELAARLLGKDGRFDGMSVLELGPLEAMHTVALERLGASIDAIESNVDAYLKCLIVKEVLGLQRARFQLGDFTVFLKETTARFDLVFCSGVLYHMSDPLDVIRDIARITDRCFVWTHYIDPTRAQPRGPVPVSRHGFAATYFPSNYDGQADDPLFLGGNQAGNVWMQRDELLAAFRHFGFDRVEVADDTPEGPNGASFSFVAQRTGQHESA